MQMLKSSSISFAVSGTFLFCCAVVVLGVDSASLADAVDRAAIHARRDALQNFTATFRLETDYDFDPNVPLPKEIIQNLPRKRREISEGAFSFLSESARSEIVMTPETQKKCMDLGIPANARLIEARSSTGRFEQLTEDLGVTGKITRVGGISETIDFPEEWTLDLALGLRLFREQAWLTKAAIGDAKEGPSPDRNLLILQVQGNNGLVHELHFDKRLLYALAYYRGTFADGTFEEIINSDFQRQGETYLPQKIVRRSQYTDSSGKPRHPITRTLTIAKYVLNDPQNVPSRFLIDWPGGLKLFDTRMNEIIEVGSTTRPLSDDVIRRQLQERKLSVKESEQDVEKRIEQVTGVKPATAPSKKDR